MGEKYRVNTKDELESIIRAFENVATSRVVCYKQGSVSPVTVTKHQYENLAEELKDSCGVVINPRNPNKYDLYQKPMYFMLLLGIVSNAGDDINEKRNLF